MTTLTPKLKADILHYYQAEHWPVGTISRQLDVHYTAVFSILTKAGLLKIGATPRHRLIDACLPFIFQTPPHVRIVVASKFK